MIKNKRHNNLNNNIKTCLNSLLALTFLAVGHNWAFYAEGCQPEAAASTDSRTSCAKGNFRPWVDRRCHSYHGGPGGAVHLCGPQRHLSSGRRGVLRPLGDDQERLPVHRLRRRGKGDPQGPPATPCKLRGWARVRFSRELAPQQHSAEEGYNDCNTLVFISAFEKLHQTCSHWK